MSKKIYGYGLMLVGVTMIFIICSILGYSQIRNVFAYRHDRQTAHTWTSKELELAERYNQQVQASDLATNDPFAETGKAEDLAIEGLAENDIFAYLRVPAISVTQPIRIGATEDNLAQGAAVVAGTALPVGGRGNRSVIAGHRSWYDDVMFLRLGDLNEGDLIFIDLADRTLTYKVREVVLMDAEDWEQLVAVEGKDMLTLLTCDPLYPPFTYRLLVNAERLEEISTSLPPAEHLGSSLWSILKQEWGFALLWLGLLGLMLFLTKGLFLMLKPLTPKGN